MRRREPVQRRSRERVDLILKAAAELLAEGGVEALTTRSLSAHADIPVATIHRYFDNRDAIIAAYLDHELEKIDAAVTAALLAIDRVTFRSLAEAVALAHMRHHQAHPEGVPFWFGGRQNPDVLDCVRALDARIAASLRSAVRTTGMMPLRGVLDPCFASSLKMSANNRDAEPMRARQASQIGASRVCAHRAWMRSCRGFAVR